MLVKAAYSAQLCLISSLMDEIKCLQECARLEDDLNFNARYANDTTLIAAIFERLQLAVDQLQEACKNFGMEINTEKCKVISDSTTNLTIKIEEIEIVKELKFLGSLVLNLSGNVKRRFALAKSAFLRLKKVYGHAETSL